MAMMSRLRFVPSTSIFKMMIKGNQTIVIYYTILTLVIASYVSLSCQSDLDTFIEMQEPMNIFPQKTDEGCPVYADITEVPFSWDSIKGAETYEILIRYLRFPSEPYLLPDGKEVDYLTHTNWTPPDKYVGVIPFSASPYVWQIRAQNAFQNYYSEEGCFYIGDTIPPTAVVHFYEGIGFTLRTCGSDSTTDPAVEACLDLSETPELYYPLTMEIVLQDNVGVARCTLTTKDYVDSPISLINTSLPSGKETRLDVTIPDEMIQHCSETFVFEITDPAGLTETVTLPVYIHPEAPELLDPIQNTGICTGNPIFQWATVKGADAYDFELYENSSISGTPIHTEQLSGSDLSSFVLPFTLDPTTKPQMYSWRVRAIDQSCPESGGDLTSSWAVENFTLLDVSITQPIYPTCGSCVLLYPHEFIWADVPNATEYTIYFFNSEDTTNLEESNLIAQETVLPGITELSGDTLSAIRGRTVYWSVETHLPNISEECMGMKSRPCELTCYDYPTDEEFTDSAQLNSNPGAFYIFEDLIIVAEEQIQNFHLTILERDSLIDDSHSKSNYVFRQFAAAIIDIAYDEEEDLIYVTWDNCQRTGITDKAFEGGVAMYRWDGFGTPQYHGNVMLNNQLFTDIGVVRPGGIIFYDGDIIWSDTVGTGGDPISDAHRMRIEPNELPITWEVKTTYDTQESSCEYTVSSMDVVINTGFGTNGYLYLATVGINESGFESYSYCGDTAINVFDLETGAFLFSFGQDTFDNAAGMATAEFCGNHYLLLTNNTYSGHAFDKSILVYRITETGGEFLGDVYGGVMETHYYFEGLQFDTEYKDLFYSEIEFQGFNPGNLVKLLIEPPFGSDSNSHTDPDNNDTHTFSSSP